MGSNQEIEIKFRVANLAGLARKLRRVGFRVVTKRTLEMNTLYDLPGEVLRRRRELLRLRHYGSEWTLTHKAGRRPDVTAAARNWKLPSAMESRWI
jgi:inorganic triphosphatase YgiF